MTTKPQFTTEETARLLPCPLFGHLPDKGEFTSGPYISVSGAPDMPKFYAVVCPGCCSTAYDEDKERVIRKWNTRTSPASAAPVVDESSVAFTAYNQAIEDAKAAIRAETTNADGSEFFSATFINVVARKCSPHVYVNRLAAAVTAAPHCLLCGHKGVAPDGTCMAPVPMCSDDYHGTRRCGCKCRFPDTTAAPVEQSQTCEWEDNGRGFWLASCGDAFKVYDNDINVTGMHFCPFCGKSIKPKSTTNEGAR